MSGIDLGINLPQHLVNLTVILALGVMLILVIVQQVQIIMLNRDNAALYTEMYRLHGVQAGNLLDSEKELAGFLERHVEEGHAH
jgi:hypothetical protein